MKTLWGIVQILLICVCAVSAEKTDADISFKGSKTRLRVQKDLFGDSFGGQVRTVPRKFNGKSINRLEMKNRVSGDKTKGLDPVHVPVDFTVKKAGNVYIMTDIRVSDSFVKDGWVVVDEGKWGWVYEGYWDAKPNRMRGYHILTKHFDVGEYTVPASEGVGTRVIDM